MLDNVFIDKHYYYNEQGQLINVIDEDVKFGAFGPDDVLKFMEEKGYINLKTGEGRDDLEVAFVPKGKQGTLPSGKKISFYWAVIFTSNSYPMFQHIYILDAETGGIIFLHLDDEYTIID